MKPPLIFSLVTFRYKNFQTLLDLWFWWRFAVALMVKVLFGDGNFGLEIRSGSFGKCSLCSGVPHLLMRYLYLLGINGQTCIAFPRKPLPRLLQRH